MDLAFKVFGKLKQNTFVNPVVRNKFNVSSYYAPSLQYHSYKEEDNYCPTFRICRALSCLFPQNHCSFKTKMKYGL